jgi:hypothetical protein
MLLAATAGGRPGLQWRFKRHAASIVCRATRARIKGAGAYLAPDGVPVRPPVAVAIPGVVKAMPPRLAAARCKRVRRLAMAALFMAARAEESGRVARAPLRAAHCGLCLLVNGAAGGRHSVRNRHERFDRRRSLGHQRASRQQKNPACPLHSLAPVNCEEHGAWSREQEANSVAVCSLLHAPCSMLWLTRRRLALRAVALIARGFNRAGRIARPDACSR